MESKSCKIFWCEKTNIAALGYCVGHYKRHKKGSDMDAPFVTPGRKPCKLDGCDRPSCALGYCNTHYERFRTGRPLEKEIVSPTPRTGGACSVDGCERKSVARGMCHTHVKWLRMGADLNKPIQAKRPGEWGKWVDTYGYLVRTRLVNGVRERQTQHIVVMEEHLGRKLLAHENVHHKNGQRADNRLENLELWSTKQPKGQRVEDKTAWAIEWLESYGYTIVAN